MSQKNEVSDLFHRQWLRFFFGLRFFWPSVDGWDFRPSSSFTAKYVLVGVIFGRKTYFYFIQHYTRKFIRPNYQSDNLTKCRTLFPPNGANACINASWMHLTFFRKNWSKKFFFLKSSSWPSLCVHC